MILKRFKDDGSPGYMFEISRVEAWAIIESLSSQVLSNSMNGTRLESFTDKGEYFSIAVVPEPGPQRLYLVSFKEPKPSRRVHFFHSLGEHPTAALDLVRKYEESRMPEGGEWRVDSIPDDLGYVFDEVRKR